jgi:hypothetical protein
MKHAFIPLLFLALLSGCAVTHDAAEASEAQSDPIYSGPVPSVGIGIGIGRWGGRGGAGVGIGYGW